MLRIKIWCCDRQGTSRTAGTLWERNFEIIDISVRKEINMSREISLSEKEVQTLIADFPWLLNMDYERVDGLSNKGMEVKLSHSKRADLILMEKRNKRPVVIEFKSVPFYRENIGQILEYKARLYSEMTETNSVLYEVFGEKLYTPILILVVPSCSEEAMLACNLSGIEVFCYDGRISEFTNPTFKKKCVDFYESFEKHPLPLDIERMSKVDEIYKTIHSILRELGIDTGWKSYRKPSGEYFYHINHSFINKYFCDDESISIGLYEDIFSADIDNKMILEFSTYDKEDAEKFRERFIADCNYSVSNVFVEDGIYYIQMQLDKVDFLNNVEEIMKLLLVNYINVMRELELM